MKKILNRKEIALVLGFLGIITHASANQSLAKNLTMDEANQVAKALETLKDIKVLTKDKNNNVNVDHDVIQRLKNEGYFQKKSTDAQVVCVGPNKSE